MEADRPRRVEQREYDIPRHYHKRQPRWEDLS